METLPSGLNATVADNEDLARFLTSSSQFNSFGVKPSAFLPNPKVRATSVFRHGGNPPEGLWQLGRALALGGRTIHGAAICKALHVRSVLLAVEAEEPPPRHANITNWPLVASDPELEKACWKELAALVAQRADLLRP